MPTIRIADILATTCGFFSSSFRLFAESVVEGGGGGGVVGSVPPLGQVQAGQDAGLAGHSRVDLVVGQHHGVHLM